MPGARIDEARPFIPVRIAVLTVSDTRSPATDKSGDTLVDRLKSAGHELAGRAIVKDDVRAIVERVQDWIADKDVDVVLSTGGTGLTGRDVTVEAIQSLFEKQIEGFSALFHQVSYETIGTSTATTNPSASMSSVISK